MRSFGDLTTHKSPAPAERNLIYFLLCAPPEDRREENRGFQSEKAFQSLEAKETRANKGFTAMDADGNADGIGRGTEVAVLCLFSTRAPLV